MAFSMKRESARKNRHRKKANHLRNQTIRADLYSNLRGENGSKRAAEWHSTLKALSMGTAG